MLSWVWERLPHPLGRAARHALALLPPGARYGRRYTKTRAFVREAQWWDEERIGEWQVSALRRIVDYAREWVPGYRDLYEAAGVVAGDLRSIADIRLLPIVTKELIRDNLQRFTSRAVPRSARRYVTTGGSTGIPFGFFQTAENRPRERAFMHAGWERAGWTPGHRVAVLRGEFVGSPERFWQHEPHRNELALSTYYLREETASAYLERLHRYRPRHLRAYPSAATHLARLILDTGMRPPALDSLLLGSENLYPWQVNLMQEAFPSSRVFAWYGHAEQVLLGAMCERVATYHMWPFYGLTEVVDDGLNKVVQPGQVGELIGTSFWNTATPFIRYRTMDRAEFGGVGCRDCGRAFPVLSRIDGRLQELVVTGTGRHISMTAINMHTDVFDGVRQFQFYQDTPGHVVLKIVPKPTYSVADTTRIRREVGKKIGDDLELSVQLVDDIPRLANGKYRFLVQRLEVLGND